jgi:hypothetical protein
MTRSLFILVVLVFIVNVVPAQTTAFTYQGSLNTSGTPANGNHDFEFALFDAASGGAQLGGTQTRPAVAVTNGTFAVTLDFGNSFPGAGRFLEIRVRTSGGGAFTPLAPRQPVNSAPYAINAAQLGGVAASEFVQSGAATINAATQFSIGGNAVLSAGGLNNVFVGVGVGSSSSGGFNTFVGTNAGAANGTGGSNSFFGFSSGRENTTGSANSFFGQSAGRDNTTGQQNAFFGSGAGSNNEGGSTNSFFGSSAGRLNTSGFGNTFVGNIAGDENTTGLVNTFIGRQAGRHNTTGTHNTFVGEQAGTGNITGGQNTLLGNESDMTDGLFNAIALGFRSFVSQSNSLVLGSIAGVNNSSNTMRVGIGTSAPATRLHVASGASGATPFSTADLVIEDNTAAFQHFITPNDIESGILFGDPGANIGGGLIFNNAATNNGIQFRAGGNTTRMTLDGSGNLGIGTTAPINRLTIGQPETPLLTGSVGIFNAGGTFMTVRDTTNNVEGFLGADSNGIVLGSMSDSFVRIRTGNANRLTFDVGGNAIFSGIVSFDSFAAANTLDTGGATPICRNASNRLSTCSSSLRYKSNVLDFSSGLKVIKKLRPVSFNWKEGGMLDLGLVAEDVAKVEPLLTSTNDNGQVEGVKYDRIGVVLVNAVKEQQAEIESQRKEIIDLRSQVEAMKKLVCATNATAEVCKQ